MTHDWIVVGAGLTGATLAERIASQRGERVLVVEQRPHVAGNTFDGPDANGVIVHHHGPHAFHTNSDRVWAYLSRFTAWHAYEHRVRVEVEGRLLPLPFNLDALDACFGADAPRLARRLADVADGQEHVPVLRLLGHADPDVRRVAAFVYEQVFLPYTLKQWGRTPHELDASVTARVPLRLSRDDRYFQDRHQALPCGGFSALVARILDHPNIHVALGVGWGDVEAMREGAPRRGVVYTGPVDALFGHCLGVLPYRSLRFEPRYLPLDSDSAEALVQPVAQVNHPLAPGLTRTTEYRHMTGQRHLGTTLVSEFPEAYVPGANEPYYPVPHPDHRALHARYLALAEKEMPGAVFCGRLADYQYYNMDQAVARALTVFDREVAPR